MDGFTIAFPKGEIANLQRQMQKSVSTLKKSEPAALKWGGITLGKSLSASSKIAPKLRRIVKNPDKGAKTDARKARFGVYKYLKGDKYFAPIRGTGEYGKIRYTDKHTMRVMEWDKTTGVRRPYDFSDTDIGAENMGLMKHKKRNIGRRGLARAVWRGCVSKLGGGVQIGVKGRTAGIARRNSDVTKRLTGDAMFVRFSNSLRYAADAFRTSGAQAVSTAMARASASMEHKVNQAIAKGFFG